MAYIYSSSIEKATEDYMRGKISTFVYNRRIKQYVNREQRKVERRILFPSEYRLKLGENANKRASKAVSD